MKKNHIIYMLLLGVIITSCRKPTDPESLTNPAGTGGYKIVKKYQTPGFAQDVIKKDNLLYIAQGEAGLLILDITDIQNPTIIASDVNNARGYSKKISMKDSMVYLAAGSYGVTSINVSNPAEPVALSYNNDMKPAKNTFVFGDYLFVSVSEDGGLISKFDEILVPNTRGKLKLSGYIQDIVVASDSNYAFAACGEVGLSMCNIKGFIDEQGYGNYYRTAWCDVPGYTESVVLNEQKSLVYTACGTAGFHIIDYSDTTNMHIAGSLDEGGYAKEIYYDEANEIVYLTAELAGLQIIDVKDATNPKLIGEIETEFALGVTIDDEYVYVADEDEGIIIISKP